MDDAPPVRKTGDDHVEERTDGGSQHEDDNPERQDRTTRPQRLHRSIIRGVDAVCSKDETRAVPGVSG